MLELASASTTLPDVVMFSLCRPGWHANAFAPLKTFHGPVNSLLGWKAPQQVLGKTRDIVIVILETTSTFAALASSRMRSGWACGAADVVAAYLRDRLRGHDRGCEVGGHEVCYCGAHPLDALDCYRARRLSRNRRKSQKTTRRKTRLLHEACGRCNRLWRTSSPCLRCRRRPLPIEYDVALQARLGGEACLMVQTGGGQAAGAPQLCSCLMYWWVLVRPCCCRWTFAGA